jgi:GNAT superfamily N-acetyltransferase
VAVTGGGPVLRRATAQDVPAIAALMQASVFAIFPAFYDARQTASAAAYIAQVDPSLIEDGTYLVHEAEQGIVSCGGWSRRQKLFQGGPGGDDGRLLDPAREAARVRGMYVRADHARRGLGRQILAACERAARAEGFTELALMATLPGVPLYRAYGFTDVAEALVTLPDGAVLAGVEMRLRIT